LHYSRAYSIVRVDVFSDTKSRVTASGVQATAPDRLPEKVRAQELSPNALGERGYTADSALGSGTGGQRRPHHDVMSERATKEVPAALTAPMHEERLARLTHKARAIIGALRTDVRG
jgi:hypothetical protein